MNGNRKQEIGYSIGAKPDQEKTFPLFVPVYETFDENILL